MNTNQKVLLKLIQKSQFVSIDTSELKETNWNELYEEALIQSVQGLVAQFAPIQEPDDKWTKIRYQQLAKHIRYCHAEAELTDILNLESIPFMIIKGNSAAIYYKDPFLRSMGDIDFIVRETDYLKAKHLLSIKGFAEIAENDRHIEYSKNGVLFELHRKFSYEDIDLDCYINEGFSSIQTGVISEHAFPMLPKLSNGLVLLAHMREHLKGGLGLRQAVDWMMYVYRELDDEFWEKEFSRVAKEKGMDTLAIVATRMCQIYMGLQETITWCKAADEELCEQLMENLLASGNFGRKQGSGNSVEFVSTHMKSQGTFRWLQKMGEYNWEAYRKHHWLKPFCWIYQGFRYTKKGFKTGRNRKQLSDDFNRSEQRYELLKKLGIE